MLAGELTLREIIAEAHAQAGVNSNTSTQAQVIEVVNRRYARAIKAKKWPTLVRTDELGYRAADGTVKVIQADDPFAPLPVRARNTEAIVIQEPRREVQQVTMEEIARRWDVSHKGLPEMYAICGETAQHTRLAADDLIQIQGDTANDGGAASVRVEFVPSNAVQGEVVNEQLSGTFSSGVAVTQAALAGWGIRRVVVNKNWTGAITIKTNDGATELGRFSSELLPAAGQAASRVVSRPLVRFGPTPEAAYKATLIWREIPRRLLKNEDTPEIPISDYLVYSACADLMRTLRRWDLANSYDAKADEALGLQNTDDPPAETTAPVDGNFLSMTGME